MPIRLVRWCFVGALLVNLVCAPTFAQSPLGAQIPSAWLRARITVAEAEREHPGLPNDPRVAQVPYIAKPFAFQNKQWEALKVKMQPGDQLWEFSSAGTSWTASAGRAGIALVRNGKVIDFIVTIMN